MTEPREQGNTTTAKRPVYTFSFRAELSTDLNRFLGRLDEDGSLTRLELSPYGRDPRVELRTELDREALLALMHHVPDGHVMRQTLKECSLAANDLERNWDVA